MAHQLLFSSSTKSLCLQRPCSTPIRVRKIVVARRQVAVRAQGKVTREYREDEDKIVVPGQEKPKDIYVQQAKVAKKASMSKEYQERLRKEYIGLGGAENKAMSQNWFLYVIVVISVLALLSHMIGAI